MGCRNTFRTLWIGPFPLLLPSLFIFKCLYTTQPTRGHHSNRLLPAQELTQRTVTRARLWDGVCLCGLEEEAGVGVEMVHFNIVFRQTGAVGQSGWEGKASHQKEAHCFHTAANKAKGGPLIPIPFREATVFKVACSLERRTSVGGGKEFPELFLG